MHILFCNWRDTRNPEGGGSERYVEEMAAGLVARGHQVTVACAEHDNAPRDEVRDGVRFVRRGTKLGIYLITFLRILTRRYGSVDLVVDVQNGLPFFTRLATRRPVIVLVHHVHREQWPVVYPGLVGRVGWWIEGRLAPLLYRRSKYVCVSGSTRTELIELGVTADRIAVVHNATDPKPEVDATRSESPRLCVLGRLVPHKQVEHALDALAAVRDEQPNATLDVMGDGWWDDELRQYAHRLGIEDAIKFHGFVDDATKHQLLAQAWIMLLPSLKEGWGIVVGEAGSHGVPTIAYSTAGGTTESIDHKDTGLLVDTEAELIQATVDLVNNTEFREFLGKGAETKAAAQSWDASRAAFAAAIGA